MRLSPALEQNFWNYIRKSDESNCWLWIGGKTVDGYGRFRIGKKSYVASRVALILSGIELKAAEDCLHTCDNPSCCNPKHLFVGNTLRNALDRSIRGRGGVNGLKGETCGRAKLTEAQVIEMRLLAKTTVPETLATKFGVSIVTVYQILARRTWRHIK